MRRLPLIIISLLILFLVICPLYVYGSPDTGLAIERAARIFTFAVVFLFGWKLTDYVRGKFHLAPLLLAVLSIPLLTGCNVPLIGDLMESKRDEARQREADALAIRTTDPRTETVFIIEGDFYGPPGRVGTNTVNTAIRFGVNNQDMSGGQILSVISRDLPGTTLDSGAGPGFWRIVGEGRIVIQGTTPFYAGQATIDGASIRLANGILLTGGSIYPVRRPTAGMVRKIDGAAP